MGLSYMKCAKVGCEKARLLGEGYCAEHMPRQASREGLREALRKVVTRFNAWRETRAVMVSEEVMEAIEEGEAALLAAPAVPSPEDERRFTATHSMSCKAAMHSNPLLKEKACDCGASTAGESGIRPVGDAAPVGEPVRTPQTHRCDVPECPVEHRGAVPPAQGAPHESAPLPAEKLRALVVAGQGMRDRAPKELPRSCVAHKHFGFYQHEASWDAVVNYVREALAALTGTR